jgi:hypothetical protein
MDPVRQTGRCRRRLVDGVCGWEERGVVILYDEVYMTDDEWVRLLISILRSLPSE